MTTFFQADSIRTTAYGSITDEISGKVSPICRVYRVQDGASRLFVGRDRRVWIGYGEEPERFSFIGEIAADEVINRENACRAANTF